MDLDTAYEIDNRVYHGQSVTDEEKATVKEYLESILNDPDSHNLGVYLWAWYSIQNYR